MGKEIRLTVYIITLLCSKTPVKFEKFGRKITIVVKFFLGNDGHYYLEGSLKEKQILNCSWQQEYKARSFQNSGI